jgi:hypothetical protein
MESSDPEEDCTDPEGQIEELYYRSPELRGRSFLPISGSHSREKGCDLLLGSNCGARGLSPGRGSRHGRSRPSGYPVKTEEANGVGLVEDNTIEGTERLLRLWFDLPLAKRDSMAARARTWFVARYAMSRVATIINGLFAQRGEETCLEHL